MRTAPKPKFHQQRFREFIPNIVFRATWYEQLVRPLLFRLDAETAHRLGLRAIAALRRAPRPLSSAWPQPKVASLEFPNILGLAAGFDKDGRAIEGLFGCGFGHIEVGTVTPRPQTGNPRPRLFRDIPAQAIVNRMGFNNQGMEAVRENLAKVRTRLGPIGVNLGKNKDTPNESAAEDYAMGTRNLAPSADYLAVNVSSPNTPGLRALQEPRTLEAILRAVRAETRKPIFLKLSPDLSDGALKEVVHVAQSCAVDGLICTNTTLEREGTTLTETGGLSGRPLRQRSTRAIQIAFAACGGRLPIIGVGGVSTGADAWEKVTAGASLVQVYSAFVYRGLRLPQLLLGEFDDAWRVAGSPAPSTCIGRDAT